MSLFQHKIAMTFVTAMMTFFTHIITFVTGMMTVFVFTGNDIFRLHNDVFHWPNDVFHYHNGFFCPMMPVQNAIMPMKKNIIYDSQNGSMLVKKMSIYK